MFLAALTTPWTALLAPARVACTAAIAAAATAVAAADAAAIAAEADHQPPTAPSVAAPRGRGNGARRRHEQGRPAHAAGEAHTRHEPLRGPSQPHRAPHIALPALGGYCYLLGLMSDRGAGLGFRSKTTSIELKQKITEK